MTELDRAHAAMSAAPDDDAARLRYYRVLSDSVLFLRLEREPAGDDLAPEVFPLDIGPVVLACDTEERLAALSGNAVPYAALPGRVIAQALAGQGVALGINLGVAESAFVVPSDALDWLTQVLGHSPVGTEARPQGFAPPGSLPPPLLAALQAKLGSLAGLAGGALLAAVVYDGGRRGHLLAFVDAQGSAEAALARAVSEALTFSGLEAGEIDVAFLAAADPVARTMARVAMRLDMAPESPPPSSPPKGPPRLR